MTNKVLEEVEALRSNRRHFVKKLGAAGAVMGATSALYPSKALAQGGPSDLDILNFALNLEYLEAEFYTVATTGQTIDKFGLSITGSGNAGATTGGAQVSFSTDDTTVRRVAMELADDEQTHVSLLQNAIIGAGGQPIAKPAINLGALNFGFGSEGEFLALARIFEDIGVTAYGGAAPLIADKGVLGYAARILATESFHSGNIRSMIDRYQYQTAALDGADVLPPPSGTKFFATDSYAISQVRTPGEVLYLAFGAGGATAGGFFPSGVNGPLNTSAAAPATGDGVTFTASPNPIPVAAGDLYGTTTITWNAPTADYIEIHVGKPDGPLFTVNYKMGSMKTEDWVTDGMVLYLQDVSYGKARTAQNTLATLIIHLQQSA